MAISVTIDIQVNAGSQAEMQALNQFLTELFGTQTAPLESEVV